MVAKAAKAPKAIEKGERKRPKWMSKDNLQLMSLVLPAVIKVFLFSYLPMWGVILAFEDFDFSLGPFKSKFVGFKNFEFFFKSNDAARILSNTMLMNFLFIVTGMVVSIALALLMYQVTSARKSMKFYQTVMFFPFFISWVVAARLLEALIGANGMITSTLSRMGIQYSFYNNAEIWRIILPICHIWKSAGYSCIIYYGVLVGTDATLYDAAKIDGASGFQIMTRLQIPFLTPMIVLNTLSAVSGILRADFGMFYFLANSPLLLKTTDVIDTYVFRAIQGMGNLSMGAAVGLFQSAVGFVLIVVANKLSRLYDPNYGLY